MWYYAETKSQTSDFLVRRKPDSTRIKKELSSDSEALEYFKSLHKEDLLVVYDDNFKTIYENVDK